MTADRDQTYGLRLSGSDPVDHQYCGNLSRLLGAAVEGSAESRDQSQIQSVALRSFQPAASNDDVAAFIARFFKHACGVGVFSIYARDHAA